MMNNLKMRYWDYNQEHWVFSEREGLDHFMIHWTHFTKKYGVYIPKLFLYSEYVDIIKTSEPTEGNYDEVIKFKDGAFYTECENKLDTLLNTHKQNNIKWIGISNESL